ncbi:GNAT family N-acetyltransferase [Streptomyces sp. SID13031]|uniref:GNAT family N-acetyltransferase n=1 Tax=Streptomyces sp. SID13031 TaxID=2706046 RepID=UPI0013C819E2|nr:GNAT family N-acetyltransferase [Streptomyces sp. SID13031]NEA36303.1 GNAT family N-acetyltransferase [Streptomyces sp. SID13031]
MSVRVTSDPKDFQATTFSFLEADPVLHTVILGNVAERAAGGRSAESEPSYFVSVHDDAGAVIGAAMRTPGRPVHLGALRADLAGEIAEAFAELVPEVGGVAGDRAAVRAFGERWAELREVTGVESRGSRLHKLEALVALTAPGNPRPMREDDVQLAAEWVSDGFRGEFATIDLAWAEHHLERGTLWIWEDGGEPVSMAGSHLPLFGVSRVGPVYTPPEHRRHGYAGALTGEVTAKILAKGNQACLYTDLANRTSNKIYAQLGYVPVADFVDLIFVP